MNSDQRLLRDLNLRENSRYCGVILTDSRYRNERFCRLFLEECDEIGCGNPPEGRMLADLGIKLANLVAQHSQRNMDLLLGHAFAVLGSSYRAVGKLTDAEAAYSLAVLHYGDRPLDKADLCRRISYLRMDQRRFEEAMDSVERSIFIYQTEGVLIKRDGLGRALLARGQIFFEMGNPGASVRDLSAALNHISQYNSIYYYAAAHNLATALAHVGKPEDLKVALHHLCQAKRLIRGRQNVPKLKLLWLESIILLRFGCNRRAERLLETARLGLIGLRIPLEAATITLELAGLYLREGRLDDLRSISAEALEMFPEDSELFAALSGLVSAAESKTVDDDLLDGIRRTIRERVPRNTL
ncbi:MAG: hypothetical protein GY856_06795 [bacterium]|nr:hypothetical protein [bacterium]